MSRTTSVTLGEPLNHFVQEMVTSGRYGSTSEVVRSALRLLEEQEQRLQHLRKLIDEGIESGESTSTVEDIMARVKNEFLSYKLSKTAERDLEQLYRHYCTIGMTQASDYLTELMRAFELLAEFPSMGISAEWIRPNLRCHSNQSHMIYYRQRANDIFIVRVLHQRMDHKSLM